MKTYTQLLEVIKKTEARYNKQKDERAEIKRKIDYKGLLQADRPERVEKRLARLGVDRLTAEALVRGALTPSLSDSRRTHAVLDRMSLERIFFKNDLMGVNYLELGMQAARSVGRIRIRTSSGGSIGGYGTGFMVSPQLLLTNNHVLPTHREASSSQIEFNYQNGIDRQPLDSVIFDLDPDTLFITDEPLDYTLVAIRDMVRDGINLSSFGWNRLIEEEGKVILGEYVSIIQHPGGERKQLALRENQLIDVLPDFLHYRTDTAPGSSGSPVFNDQWEVVALHHSGVPRRDSSQKHILSLDGSIWTDAQGEQKIDWIANEGARISRIVKHINQQNLSTHAKKLRNQMFELEPKPSPLPPSTSHSTEQPPTISSDGTITWTIPIQVSVRLGQPTMTSNGTNSTNGAQSNGSTKSRKSELDQALEELREASQRPYYDQRADEQNRQDYYSDLDADSLSPAQLFRELNQLLEQTHTKRLPYKPGTHLYPWIDLQPNQMLQSIYTGEEYDPRNFIREAFRTEQLRILRTQEIYRRESTLSDEQMQQESKLLEARFPYNCEHVVPQSWFDEDEPMRGDLHHLFTCEQRCNAFRGNNPYVDFPEFEEKIMDGCGMLSDGEFEPIRGKGAVARATLYFLLRHPKKANKSSKKYSTERLGTLLNWHHAESPSKYEHHRNAAIFEKQGNRNPLIDFPAWADNIDFSLGLN